MVLEVFEELLKLHVAYPVQGWLTMFRPTLLTPQTRFGGTD
jgi:hypothetical protein